MGAIEADSPQSGPFDPAEVSWRRPPRPAERLRTASPEQPRRHQKPTVGRDADWERGELLYEQETPLLRDHWLLVPGETVDEEKVAEAIRRWHRRRYAHRRGHWTRLEGAGRPSRGEAPERLRVA